VRALGAREDFMRVWCCLAIAVGCAPSVGVSAQSRRISFVEALTMAREQSPASVVARARVEEVRGRLAGARVRFRENPTFEAFAGPRRGDGGTTPDFDVGFNQLFETGGQRAARIAGAEAAIAAEQSTTEDVTRRALEAVALGFFRTVHSQERLRLLADAEMTAQQVLQIATRRYESGDIAVLDVNIAKTALTRARSTRMAADADRVSAAGVLGQLLALPAGSAIVADGTLSGDRSIDLPRLIAAIDNRPDLRTLRAALTEAEADARLGRGLRRPDVGVGIRASREGRDHIVVGGLTVALPTFNSGQELLTTGTARASRIRIELETTRAAAIAEVRTLYDAQLVRAAAAAAYELEALPSAAENEQLAERSFEVGQLTLADFLVVRRELTDTRLEYLDRLLESVETAVRRDAAAGVLQ
jgi:outer membrane protein, heavy metal efflux system